MRILIHRSRFRDSPLLSCEGSPMATPTAALKDSETSSQAALESELQQAETEFADGDFVEITLDELDACVAAGTWPWQRASSG